MIMAVTIAVVMVVIPAAIVLPGDQFTCCITAQHLINLSAYSQYTLDPGMLKNCLCSLPHTAGNHGLCSVFLQELWNPSRGMLRTLHRLPADDLPVLYLGKGKRGAMPKMFAYSISFRCYCYSHLLASLLRFRFMYVRLLAALTAESEKLHYPTLNPEPVFVPLLSLRLLKDILFFLSKRAAENCFTTAAANKNLAVMLLFSHGQFIAGTTFSGFKLVQEAVLFEQL